jgi:outer membrane lipoprotein-sorting protein
LLRVHRFASMSSKRYALIFFLLPCVFPSWFNAGTACGNELLTDALNGILERYGGLPGLSVPYQREIITRSMAILGDDMKTDIASGTFVFEPPCYLKVVQDLPQEEIITTDGQTIWWYIPEKKVVYRYPAGELGKELLLLSNIFNGLSRVTEGFEVTLERPPDKREYNLRLTPKETWEEIDHISLTVNSDSFAILAVEIHNLLGTITRFKLGDFSVREDLEKSFFELEIPDGVELIEE